MVRSDSIHPGPTESGAGPNETSRAFSGALSSYALVGVHRFPFDCGRARPAGRRLSRTCWPARTHLFGSAVVPRRVAAVSLLRSTLGNRDDCGRLYRLLPVVRRRLRDLAVSAFDVAAMAARTFGAMVFGAILLIGALCFFPALALGPIVEQIQHSYGETDSRRAAGCCCRP